MAGRQIDQRTKERSKRKKGTPVWDARLVPLFDTLVLVGSTVDRVDAALGEVVAVTRNSVHTADARHYVVQTVHGRSALPLRTAADLQLPSRRESGYQEYVAQVVRDLTRVMR